MNVTLFSNTGVEYTDSHKGDCTAIYIPTLNKERLFTDIPDHNINTVRDRYSDKNELTPLWRSEGPYVRVYGSIIKELKERRSSVAVHLAQDFIPKDYGAFYLVFGDTKIVHGVRKISDDGQEIWGTSRISFKGSSMATAILSSISERVINETHEKIMVAVYDNKDLSAELARTLSPFEVEIVKFDDLKVKDNVKPIYVHKDYGLLMLTMAVAVFLCLLWTLIHLTLGFFTLEAREGEIVNISDEIRKVQSNKKLGHIKSPEVILRAMDKPMEQPPSAIIHTVGMMAKHFGDVQEIVLENNQSEAVKSNYDGKVERIVYSNVTVDLKESELLLDQEQVAKSAIENTPAIRVIERTGNNRKFEMKVGVQVR